MRVQASNFNWKEDYLIKRRKKVSNKLIVCLNCKHVLGQVDAIDLLYFRTKHCFYVVTGDATENRKLKIRIVDEVLEHHILPEISEQMLGLMEKRQTMKSLESSSKSCGTTET